MIRFHQTTAALLPIALAIVLTLFANPGWGEEPASDVEPAPVVEPAPAAEPAPPAPVSEDAFKNLKIPGLTVNAKERCVDVESMVCLDEGFLELIACTKDTKEHESIIAIEAKPSHIHVALLLLGAKPGNPAMRKPIDEERTRWVHVPPRGHPVDVYLVLKNEKGEMVEHPISDFVMSAEEDEDVLGGDDDDDDEEGDDFPHTFVFAGSHLHGNGEGPRQYLSDLSGNVISISTFGDELLCLPNIHGHANGALMWQINATKLPKVGSKVILRLRPQALPAVKAAKPDPGLDPADGNADAAAGPN